MNTTKIFFLSLLSFLGSMLHAQVTFSSTNNYMVGWYQDPASALNYNPMPTSSAYGTYGSSFSNSPGFLSLQANVNATWVNMINVAADLPAAKAAGKFIGATITPAQLIRVSRISLGYVPNGGGNYTFNAIIFDPTDNSETTIYSGPSSTLPFAPGTIPIVNASTFKTLLPGINYQFRMYPTGSGTKTFANVELYVQTGTCPTGIPVPVLSGANYNTTASSVIIPSSSNTVDLSGITATNSNTNYPNISWHTGTPATAANKITNITAVTEGTYHAASATSDGACFSDTISVCVGKDADGDAVPNLCDQDVDNDGILNTDECGSTNRVANGTFPTSGNNTNTVPGWTVGGTYSAVWPSNIGRVNLNVNGLEFRRDEATTTTLSQNLTGVTSGAVLSLNQMYWFRTAGTEANNSFTLTISYAGVTYATITSTGAPAPSIQSFNGASVNISSLPAIGSQVNVSSKVDVVITLPYTLLPATGTLLFNFAAGVAATQVRDLGMQSVSLISCKDTDNDLIPDYLDLDSDNDGCPDAIEGAGTITYSQLNSNNQISGSVNSNGVPTAASGGQAVGTSTNSTVKAPECSTCDVGNPAFIDSDGDGVGNDCDQDDDNDGILDVNEGRTIGTANGTNTQYVNAETTAFNASLGACTNVNIKVNDATNQIGTYKSFTQAQLDFSAIVSQDLGVATTVPIVGAFSTSSPNNTTLGDITYLVTPGKFEQFNVYIADPENTSFVIRAYDAANNQLQAVDWSVATFSRTTPSSPSSFLAMPIINSNNVTYSPTNNQSQMPDDAFRVRFGEATMKNAVKIVISINRNNTASANVDEIEYFVSGICLADTDNDGTPDKLDKDSDNDGCIDAVEGAGNIILSQTTNGQITGAVDGNGVPTVVGASGQGVGSSANPAVRSGCEPDLSIVKTVNNATPNVGSQIEFSLVITNNGPLAASGVVVNDLLPLGYTFQSAVAPAGTTYSSATGVWTIGTLANGATTTLIIRALANSTGNYLNTATVSSSETDPVPGNNMSSVTTAPVVQNECMGTTATKLNLSGGVLISGTANTVGAKYKYSNVIAGTGVSQQADIVFELTALDFGSTLLANNYNFVYDAPQSTAGIENNFQPSFLRSTTGTILNIPNGTYHQSSTWKATIFKAGTTTPYNVPTIIQVIDNDGSIAASTSTFESVEFLSPLPAQILTSTPTTQVVTGNIVKSNGTVQAGVTVDPQYSAYGNYGLANEFSFKLDNEVIINGSSGSINSNLANRFASVNFGCDFSGTNNFTKQTVSGTVFTDTDGGTPSGIPYTNGNVFANLVDPNGNIAASQVVSTTNGTYSFANIIAGTYTVLLTNTVQTVGAVAPSASSLPPNYVNVTSTDASPTDGITTITVAAADVTGVNFGINLAVCYETPTNLTASVPVKHGITVLGRAGADNGNWPMLRNSAYTALEGKTKGFVVTRNSSPETTITNPVVGMMVFDTNEGATGCLKIYTGSAVGEGWKCFSTQGCP